MHTTRNSQAVKNGAAYVSTVPQRSRRGPQNNLTQKTALISPDDDEVVLVR